MAQTKPKRSLWRYDLTGAREPANGLGRPAPSVNIRTSVVAIHDPMQSSVGNGNERLLARVNRNVDILETERSHGHISEAEYRVGRELMRIFEFSSRPPSASNWRQSGRVDISVSQSNAVERHLEAAEKIKAQRERVVKAIGEAGYKFLERILRDGMTYAQVAAATRGDSDHKRRFIAQRFRMCLSDLVEASAARGPAR
jgi:hypothetical protein